MVDPVTTTLAATAVGYLTPYLAEAGKEGAKKLGGAAADGAVRLLGFLKGKLTKPEEQKALADLEADPADADNQADLRKRLKDALAADPALREELRRLVEGLPAPAVEQRMAVTGDDNQSIQNVGSGSTFNVRGRGGA